MAMDLHPPLILQRNTDPSLPWTKDKNKQSYWKNGLNKGEWTYSKRKLEKKNIFFKDRSIVDKLQEQEKYVVYKAAL